VAPTLDLTRGALHGNIGDVDLESYFTILGHKGDYVYRHTHEYLELVYYRGGYGRSTIRNRRYQLHRGSFTITPSGTYHDQENLTDLSSFCMLLSGSRLEGYIGGWTDSSGTVGRMVTRLDAELAGKKRGYELICTGILHEIAGFIERLTEEYRAHSHLSKRDLVDSAMTIIRQEEGLLNIADLARWLNVSKDYLRHLFLEFAGRSPQKVIISTRLRKAAALLEDQHFTVTEIAEQCGFGDVYYFSSQFKKKLSMTPTEFRKRCAAGCDELRRAVEQLG